MINYVKNPVICIGGANIDRLGRTHQAPILGTSNPGSVMQDHGGVARNVAENLARLGCQVALFTRVGKDDDGHAILKHLAEIGIDASTTTVSDTYPTGSYTAIIGNDGEMLIALADMQIYSELTAELMEEHLVKLRRYQYWFVDSNLSSASMEALFKGAHSSKVCVGAVSIAKAERLKPLLGHFYLLFANLREGRYLAGLPDDDNADPLEVVAALQAAGCPAGVLTASQGHITVWSGSEVTSLPALRSRPQDVTGGGDSLAAGTIYGLLKGLSLSAAVQWGIAAASVTVESPNTVASSLSPSALASRMNQGRDRT